MSEPIRIVVPTEVRRAFFTANELARYLNLSLRTVRQILADGTIASYEFEGARRIHADDVDEYVAARRTTSARRRS